MATEELTKERDDFWRGIFRGKAEEFFRADAGKHFDETPALQQSFSASPRPSAAELSQARQRYIETHLRQIRSDPSPNNPLK